MPPLRRVLTSRACDSCRRRKVKCDAEEVCGNCRISQLPCSYTSSPQKRGPKNPRRSAPTLERLETATTPPVPRGPGVEDLIWPSPNASVATAISHSGTLTTSAAETDLTPSAGLVQSIRDNLMDLMSSALPSLPVLGIAEHCIDLYMQYTFPTAPIVHEPTLRAIARRFFSRMDVAELFRADSHQEEVALMRDFALITGLCAAVASTIPQSILQYRQLIANLCLNSSRETLKIIEDFDVEHPNSTSISIRVLHTVALQNITGTTQLARYVLGQAALIVLNMRLYSEDTFKSHDALEAQLLRHLYWQMYAADQASACLRNRAFHLHDLLYDEEPTICPPTGELLVPQVDMSKGSYDERIERRLLIGFYFLPRLWSSAARLISELKIHEKGTRNVEKPRLTHYYMEFLGIMDDLPTWLQAANIIISPDDGTAVQFQKTAFWVQRCTILVTFQCLRLVILQQCIESKLCDIMGLNDQPLTLEVTKIGMVHDFVQTLDDIPFVYLQVKGEPTVERIRRVGSIILEILDNATNERIRMRAEHYFTRLLDILARLDSKSSDVLVELRESNQARVEVRLHDQLAS